MGKFGGFSLSENYTFCKYKSRNTLKICIFDSKHFLNL
ncbi:hypothetical protein LEP1GSC074_2113 [Leptospira noguchii str. Hook]|nr:hypothetical protein LEP1GSC074_2113 [Leptospira noguchii str. Hook]